MAVSERDVDKGWAWIIFLAGFLNFFLCGILYISGVFNVMFLDQYNQSKAATSWTGALAIGLFSLAAPLGSLSNAYLGPRITIYIGGLLSSMGYILTYFATSLVHVIITFGVLQGTGICLMYYSSLVSIGFYFRRYRNLAYGLSLTGIGVGIMVFPLLLDYLFEEYGKRASLLIVGAIQTHSFVAAALTRPFTSRTKIISKKDGPKTASQKTEQYHDDNNTMTYIIVGKENLVKECDKIETKKQENSDQKLHSENTNNKIMEAGSGSSVKNECASNEEDSSDSSSFSTVLRKYVNMITELLILKFIVYCISLFLNGIAMYSMYVHFPAYAKSIGVSPQFTSVLLTIMGGGSIACRIVVGIFTNGSKTKTLATYTGAGILSGIVCLLAPYMCLGFIGQLTFAILFSFFGNIFIALMSPVVIDLMGLEKSVATTGIALFMIGIGAVGGPPIFGLLADLTDTYNHLLPLTGACFLIGGLVMLAIPIQSLIKSRTK